MKLHKIALAIAACFMLYKLCVIGQFWMSGTEPETDIDQMIRDQKRKPLGVNVVENTDDGLYLGRSALLIAVTQARPDWVKALLENGANVNFQDLPVKAGTDSAQKNTPLHYALQSYGNTNNDVYRDIINMLLAHGADINKPNQMGSPPLHFVPFIDQVNVGTKRIEMARLLLSQRPPANINQQDYAGNTLLHLAMQRNDVGWIQVLLSDEFRNFLKEHGQELKVLIKNKDGRIPREVINFTLFNAAYGGPDTPGGTPTMETKDQVNVQSLYNKLLELEREEAAQAHR